MLVTVVDDHRFRAMGTACHVQVVAGPAGAPDVAEAVVRADEDRWSRFRDHSEIRRLPTGVPTRVGPETAALLALALEWRGRSDGRFDPLLGRQLRAAGYDRTFDELRHASVTARDPGPRVRFGVTVVGDVVTVPPGVEIDLGGIAKGHSADRAAAAVLATGAAGVCVNLGGDLRCAGESPSGDGWWTALDHGAAAEATGLAVGMVEGAVATSTTRRRRWVTTDGVEQHHVLDPRTGRPARTTWPTVTVVAATAATAEVLATVALLATRAEAERLLAEHGAVAVATDDAGTLHRIGDVAPLLARLDDLPDHERPITTPGPGAFDQSRSTRPWT